LLDVQLSCLEEDALEAFHLSVLQQTQALQEWLEAVLASGFGLACFFPDYVILPVLGDTLEIERRELL
jgi:type II secretory pathway component PulL